MSRKIAYTAKLSPASSERVTCTPCEAREGCYRAGEQRCTLTRTGRHIATFIATPAQVRKARRQRGVLNISSASIHRAQRR